MYAIVKTKKGNPIELKNGRFSPIKPGKNKDTDDLAKSLNKLYAVWQPLEIYVPSRDRAFLNDLNKMGIRTIKIVDDQEAPKGNIVY